MNTLDVWPPLPLLISDRGHLTKGLDNLIALLEHSDRVCQINFFDVSSSQCLEKILAATQKPFPLLTDLMLWSSASKMPVVDDSFLGGFAPRLRELVMDGIPFPGLAKLLLSATNLVGLHLFSIPHSGYIPPETMVATLSTLTNLESLHLQFKSPRSRPNRASRPSLPARIVLPVLTSVKFKGVSTYLEDLVAWVDAPRLGTLFISFFNYFEFGTPNLVQFICRTPGLKKLERAVVSFEYGATRVDLTSWSSGHRTLNVGILCREVDRHISSLEQVFISSLPSLSTLEDLYIYDGLASPLDGLDYIEIFPWLVLLRPFAAVKNLYLSEQFAPYVGFALKELVGSKTTEVLPNLKNISLERLELSGPAHEDIRLFVAARQVTNRPIAVTCWDRRVEDEDYDGEDYDMDYDGGVGEDDD